MPNVRHLYDGIDLHVGGTLTANALIPSDGTVTGSKVSAVAADAIPASKLQRGIVKTYAYLTSTTSAAVARSIMHVMRGAGTLVDFGVGSVTKATVDATAVFDLLRNGTTILSATITLDSGNTNYVLEAASGFSSTALVAGDVLEWKCTSATAAAGAVPVGVFAQLILTETYA